MLYENASMFCQVQVCHDKDMPCILYAMIKMSSSLYAMTMLYSCYAMIKICHDSNYVMPYLMTNKDHK